MPVSYVLRHARSAPVSTPELDASQRAVLEHPGGPLLVLAGPGTGKTTTLVELVADRVQRRGLRADQVLVLTFSRRAADQLRARILARLGQSTATPTATTFHSFCYALVRRFGDPADYTSPLQLLSAPEQDVRIRELLDGSLERGRHAWPRSLRAAVTARGMAPELSGMLARLRSLGLDPDQLSAAGRAHRRPDWVAAGDFLEEYLQVMDRQGLVDHSEIVHRARLIAGIPEHQATLRQEFALVVVDEYQDTDPAQVGLLRGLAGNGRDLVAVGDPDQSIYAFRGADVRGILGFPTDFPTGQGRPAPVLALSSTRRFGPRILAVSRSVGSRLPLPPGLQESTRVAFRNPRSLDPPHGDGTVEVATFTSAAAEAENVADLLRRAHLDDDVPWSQMAVLVRAGASIPRLRRSLVAAGVPVEVAGGEIPQGAEPAVRILLMAVRAVLHIVALRSAYEPSAPRLDAEALLTSPLCRMDARQVRRLAQQLRSHDRRPSCVLLAEAVIDPSVLSGLRSPEAATAARFATLLSGAADMVEAWEPAEQVLWHLWSGSRWPRRLLAEVDAGGATAVRAGHDLDAVCALFDQAAQAEERQQRRGVRAFLDEIHAQQIPGRSLADLGARRTQAVRLLTAHRAKGLEWRIVVVAGVQEGVWPDVRHRGSLLQADRLLEGGDQAPASPSRAALLAQERRLFYVAVTRARQRLVVTAVASRGDDGDQPSRFLTELVEPGPSTTAAQQRSAVERLRAAARGRPRRPLSLRGLLADLRHQVETTEDPVVRTALARRIATIAALDTGAGALVPAAHPDRWWGVLHPSESEVPVRPVDAGLALSASSVDAVSSCPLRWFLGRKAGGATAQTTATGFGSVVHALAAAVLCGDVEAEPAAMREHLDRVWGRLDFAVPWAGAAERTAAEAALERFVSWHLADRGREPLAAEHAFEVDFEVAGQQVVLRGSMDRVEVDADGRVVVVDFKTGRHLPRQSDIAQHAQLGAYQLAVRHGAVDELVLGPARLGGAELVALRTTVRGATKVQHQPALVDDSFAEDQLGAAISTLRGEDFPAKVGGHCRSCDFSSCCPAQAAGASLLSVGRRVAAADDD
ncbi:MAG: ATP-dependent helicase [Actinomycetota bacterium]|nr:ATP-dependent helicase [Actinomycetota bacterium]